MKEVSLEKRMWTGEVFKEALKIRDWITPINLKQKHGSTTHSHVIILATNLWQEVNFLTPYSGSNSPLLYACLTRL